MGDFKSKLPDFKELSSMTSKLFKGLKSSVDDIIKDYKDKRTEPGKKEPKAQAHEKKHTESHKTEVHEKKKAQAPKRKSTTKTDESK